MNKQNINFQIQGEKAVKTYLTDPYISNGSFMLINNEVDSVRISVKSVSIVMGANQEKVKEISVFDMDKEKTVNIDNFLVQPNSRMSIIVGFPRIPIQEHLNKNTCVKVIFEVQGKEIQAISNVEFTRRIPLH